jgi:hypothetical protein
MFDMVDPVQWAFLQNYHLDKSNACVHCAPVKFSPLTFRLFQTLMNLWGHDEDITQEMAEVRSHLDKYELDPGR